MTTRGVRRDPRHAAGAAWGRVGLGDAVVASWLLLRLVTLRVSPAIVAETAEASVVKAGREALPEALANDTTSMGLGLSEALRPWGAFSGTNAPRLRPALHVHPLPALPVLR